MAVGNFEACAAETAKWEGTWSNHRDDPGGATMYGITIAKYREHRPGATAADLRKITKAEVLAIYKKDFWIPINGDGLALGVDLAVYDAGVNSGVSRARKWLIASVGGPPVDTIKKVCARRIGFMQSLRIWKTFGRGWSRRVAGIEAKAISWALSGSVTTPSPKAKDILRQEAKDAQNKSVKNATGGVGAGGAGGAGTISTTHDQLAAGSIVVLLVVVAVIAGLLFWRAHLHHQRKLAFEAEAARG